ncbi:peptidoglycan/xylan/chitin deacetylase (PgdA/CDA1 family) [Pedobacter cryoconitis]|uniref:Peptidoglycan/xylan/chitin deacetylase (PgdA/CDA1 family) n=1 Tax=Pedobacter cryoconitis TaxID=188932 RepID=A0A7W8ZQN7_9SPHI|nr:polysaccharide deacetylase family protein [Pedobacter cryoconitis]MBB5638210.1 peptidoglycan/xylan/chitin deacetylase (PgdA/CDA1 family) [Pedobacter cryoconitis]
MSTRKDFIRQSAILGAGSLLLPSTTFSAPQINPLSTMDNSNQSSQWADGTRLVISISMQFEAGGEPEIGFDSPFPSNLEKGYTDLPAKTWFQYGYKQGIPRLLDLWDKYNIKVTSHMIGEAVRHSPELAREIVKRGHEAAAHGLNWTPQYNLSYEEEKKFIQQGVAIIKEVTGKTTVGYNCNWLRRSKNTLPILQELGFTYHIDDLSRDEPFLIPVKGKNFAVVPYTLRCNDIQLLEGRYFSSQQFGEQLRLEFDQLYEEGAKYRRQMSISTHDRISGTPAQVRVLDQFLAYAAKQPGVKFMRKDEIAKMAFQDKTTLIDSDYR